MEEKKQDKRPGKKNKKRTLVSSMEEMMAILEGHAIKMTENGETKFFYLKENEKAEVAHQIAEMYLQQHPRPLYYATHLSSTDDDSKMTLYHRLTDEEIAVIRQLEKVNEEEEIGLQEYLEAENEELLEKLLSHSTPMELDVLDSCDLNDTLQFTHFSVQVQKEDGSLWPPHTIGCPLTDEEFVELLEQCLLTKNQLSMNMLVYRKPEIAQHVISHLIWAYCDNMFEMSEPFICELDELKSIARSILDPSQDSLHLFSSDDIRILAFLKGHKIMEKKKRKKRKKEEKQEKQE